MKPQHKYLVGGLIVLALLGAFVVVYSEMAV